MKQLINRIDKHNPARIFHGTYDTQKEIDKAIQANEEYKHIINQLPNNALIHSAFQTKEYSGPFCETITPQARIHIEDNTPRFPLRRNILDALFKSTFKPRWTGNFNPYSVNHILSKKIRSIEDIQGFRELHRPEVQQISGKTEHGSLNIYFATEDKLTALEKAISEHQHKNHGGGLFKPTKIWLYER